MCYATDLAVMGDLERCLAWTILQTSEHSPLRSQRKSPPEVDGEG